MKPFDGVDFSMPNLLGLAGVIATLIFGLLSIYLFARRKYPGRLVFMEEQCLPLFEDLVKNLPRMQVLYDDKPVSDNLVLLKGLILNVGSKDVSREMIEQPLQIVVSDGFKWLAAKIVSSSPGVKGRVTTLGEATLEFDLGLFRCEECIRFEALVEVPRNAPEGTEPATEFRRIMSFRHRIADTAKVEKRPMPGPASPWETIFQFIFLLIFALATIAVLQSQSSERRLYYVAPNSTATDTVEASPINATQIKLKGVNSKYETVIPMSLFKTFSPIIGPRRRNWVFRTYIACIFMILGGFVFSETKKYFRTFRLRKIILRFSTREERQDSDPGNQILASQSVDLSDPTA